MDQSKVKELKSYIKKFDLTYGQVAVLLAQVKIEFQKEMLSNKLV